jgi:hypothetical protein
MADKEGAAWKDHPAKALLTKALSDGDIPVQSKELGPKAVYNKYKDTGAFAQVPYDNSFTRRLRDLRKKELERRTNGGKETDKKKIDWQNHPAKAFLKEAFANETIPLDYLDTIGPLAVWETHCKNHPAFAEMDCDGAFKRRLKSVAISHKIKVERKAADRLAFENYRANHPINTHNQLGQPRWDGSKAQALLKEEMEAGVHLQYAGRPREMRETREEYQEFSKQKFRDHIQQEKRLGKFKNYLEKQKDK